MSKELTLKKDINHEHNLSVIEQVVMQGDLSKLDSQQRVTYYNHICHTLGLNPYTRPFEYINLNGKLTLYAKKDATEQLRKVNKISITELEGRLIDDLYIVTAKARTSDGRIDQSCGAVTIGHLKGEQKANAIMKAETKAKRRVTLSISGLGWTDESEIESIPNATPAHVDIETGIIENTEEKISTEEYEMLNDLIGEDEDYRKNVISVLNKANISGLKQLPKRRFAELHNRITEYNKMKIQEIVSEEVSA